MPGMDSMLPPLGWHSLLTQWTFRPVWDLVLLVALVAYLGGLVVARRRGERAVHPVRIAAFLTGWTLLVLTLSSGLEVYGSLIFWIHMIQHLLLIMVVPALLVLGHPLTVLVAATPVEHRHRVTGFLTSAPVALVTRPLVGFAVYAAVIVGTHLTSFMDLMMSHTWLTSTEQVLYLGSGYLFLLPLLGGEPIRWHPPQLFRILLLVIGMIPDTVVGIVLLQTDQNLFPHMLADRPAWAPEAVHDINIGGGLMWALGDGLMMVFAVGLVVALISRPGRTDLLGGWLEGVRRETMQAHVGEADDDPRAIGTDDDVDEDEAVLEAYNRMLGRMNQP